MKYFKKLIHLVVILTAMSMASCSKKEDSGARQARIQQAINAEIEIAQEYLDGGNPDQSMAHLEELLSANPNNVEILKAIAMGYSVTGESALAAFYFEQVARLDSSLNEFRIFAALAYSDINDWASAARNYTIYLEAFPNDLPSWNALAHTYEQNKQPEEALQAYLKASSLLKTEPTPEAALKIAKLYQKINLPSDAKPWHEKVHKLDSENTEALIQLVKIECLEENYPLAEEYLSKLEKLNPTMAVSATLRAQKKKVENWRRSQDKAMALINEVKSIFGETQEMDIKIEKPEMPEVILAEGKEALAVNEQQSNEPFSGEIELDEEGFSPQEIRSNKESRDPLPEEYLFGSEYKLAQVVAKNTVEEGSVDIEALEESKTAEEFKEEPLSASDHAEVGKKLKDKGEYKGAIKSYWKSLTMDPKPSETWHELSHAYFESENYDKAEMTALESVRRNSSNIHYKMHYLKVIQMTRPAEYVISELQKAKNEFPNDLDITLALARGYVSQEDKRHDAIMLYKEFLSSAPKDHPSSEEAQRALNIIR